MEEIIVKLSRYRLNFDSHLFIIANGYFRVREELSKWLKIAKSIACPICEVIDYPEYYCSPECRLEIFKVKDT